MKKYPLKKATAAPHSDANSNALVENLALKISVQLKIYLILNLWATLPRFVSVWQYKHFTVRSLWNLETFAVVFHIFSNKNELHLLFCYLKQKSTPTYLQTSWFTTVSLLQSDVTPMLLLVLARIFESQVWVSRDACPGMPRSFALLMTRSSMSTWFL